MPKELIARAKKEIHLADHLIYVTFPLIRETKFLLSIAEHVIKSSELALEAVLKHARLYKRIEPYATNFAARVDVFQAELQIMYNFNPEHTHLLRRLAEFKQHNKESVMKFRRKDKYILTTRQYEMKILDLERVKRMCEATKKFINTTENVIRD